MNLITLVPDRLIRSSWVLLLAAVVTGCATSLPTQTSQQAPIERPPETTTSQAPTSAQPPAPVTVPLVPHAPEVAEMKSEHPVDLKAHSVLGLQEQKDIWERIRRGFAMPDLDNDLVRNREQWYASRPDYMLRMTERSRPYLFHIVEELERRNMPMELALLPFIESAFNPQAVSSAKAAGMWQFMPATGKYFDLKQNLFRDERRDVLESTRAALDYLQKLYTMFGDWHLALAAYNWGEGSVGRALARNKAQGKPLTYSDLRMPNETRFYVPKLQAVKNIVARPEAFNTELPLIQNHPYFKSVAIERDIDVAMAAKLANVSLDDFKALNPAMNRPVILAAGTPHILLPWDNATVFETNLQARPDRRLSSWTAWQAPRTMRPDEVAKLVGMSAEQLRSVNGIPARMLVRAGSTLLVPRQGKLDNDVTEHLADNGLLLLAPEVVLRKIRVKARAGDTLARLASRHGVSAANVADWNRLQPNAKLSNGQKLSIYVPAKASRRPVKSSPRRAAVQRGKAPAKAAVRGTRTPAKTTPKR
ncbi:transglycosylase SLT domain-containing protein [Limnohabitans sp. Bal53]|uniref:transglycosylase SLT domain-containing protein n=1 Tax=Limnohabitans sp. Bal53 TaxID=1977910 RepID=UPI000D3C76E5|nr:transglycosylase SLT domain-containing protein [Limnohabitans sp. Bal53]PUE40193.1 lytic transglycosylase [Limnohabitans sp. Bal53]